VSELRISLAAARVNVGLTQENVEKKMKVSKNTIVNWEKGKIKIKPAQLYYLCTIYNISTDNIEVWYFF